MFDPVTAELIGNAAPLPGLDPATLVDTLTTAYVEIAAARLQIGGSSGDQVRLGFAKLVQDMSRLADTYEAEIVLDVQQDHRRSMAFVAGSARQVLGQIDRLVEREEHPTLLDGMAIGAEIAAALLFLIAERSSDAYEASRDIRAAGETNPIRRALILSVGRFARGQFEELDSIVLEDERSTSTDPIETAVDVMYRELLRSLIILARVGLGLNGRRSIETAREIFDGVARAAVSTHSYELSSLAPPLRTTSVFGGPFHLASLLSKAIDGFENSMLVLLPTPAGAAPEQWKEWLRSEAGRWPFLWENHRDAVATGYLDRGASLVMTTPTGSGKSTLATLKIVATLAGGKTVVYLAPTHALVSQIEDDLNKRLVSIAKVQSVENMGLNETVQSLPDVAVVTPERCFALLT
ncbi:MAG: DEAD/DEAH box helicase, partial [Cytophagaceae bacterium]